MHSASDEQLLQQLRSGDTAAFAELYERYKGRLYAYCLRFLRSEPWAEDAVHNTFLKMYTGVHSITSPHSFRLWIFRVARNEALMILRDRKKEASMDPDAVWDDETPFDIVVRKEVHELAAQLLDKLSIAYREVIVLREFEQLSYAEIAGLTGTTVSSVKSRIFKARKAMEAKIALLGLNERSDP